MLAADASTGPSPLLIALLGAFATVFAAVILALPTVLERRREKQGNSPAAKLRRANQRARDAEAKAEQIDADAQQCRTDLAAERAALARERAENIRLQQLIDALRDENQGLAEMVDHMRAPRPKRTVRHDT